MKTLLINRFFILFILTMGWMTVKGQQQLEVPGDNFSLEGALEIFKKSESPEEFERKLNDPEVRVNNLDLNGDGYIDYIRVIDYYEDNVHAFVLQAVISERQSQDIAVITLEKLAGGRAVLQITGDADIYGVETIIEPTTEVRTYAGANRSRVVVNVWSWPLVRYIYSPHYSVWVSPWGWGHRPYWWSPWRPVVYYDYYSFWSPYRSYYSLSYTHRVVYAYNIYRSYRTTSIIVHKRHHHRIKEYRTTHLDRNGRYQHREDRYRSRRQPNSVRYNSDGRIVSNANNRVSTTRSYSRSRNSIGRRGSAERRESGNTIQRSRNNSRDYSGNYNARRSTERSNSNSRMQRSDRSSNMKQSSRRSSGNSDMRNPSLQRSQGRSKNDANYRQSNRNSNLQRPAQRSSGKANIQRSQQRSRNNSSYRQSKGNSNSRKSYNRSSGNSGSRSAIRSSSGRKSSGNRSNIRGSSGSSKSRSSGNSNRSNGRRR